MILWHYFVCGYCGNSGKRPFKRKLRPRCKCKGGNGKTYMERCSKIGYESNNRNQKAMKKLKNLDS